MEESWLQLLLLIVAGIISSIFSAKRKKQRKAAGVRAEEHKEEVDVRRDTGSSEEEEPTLLGRLAAQIRLAAEAEAASFSGEEVAVEHDREDSRRADYLGEEHLDVVESAAFTAVDSVPTPYSSSLDSYIPIEYTFTPVEEGVGAILMEEEAGLSTASIPSARLGASKACFLRQGFNLRDAIVYDAVLRRPYACWRGAHCSTKF